MLENNYYTYNMNDTNGGKLYFDNEPVEMGTGEIAAKMDLIAHIENMLVHLEDELKHMHTEWCDSAMTYELYQSELQHVKGQKAAYEDILFRLKGDQNG